MSKILEKAFDATKKIIRSVFLGSPNLITSSDLNRQIEALKYQLDLLDNKTGMIISGAGLTYVRQGSSITVVFSNNGIAFKGCKFSPAHFTDTINLTSSAPKVYLCLTAETETVTYDSDFSHAIAGAKFEDGTSYPAANQVVYKNEAIVLTHALSDVENLVGVIAIFTLSDNSNVIVRENFTKNEYEDNLAMGKVNTIADLNTSAIGVVTNGDTYDVAFSKLQNQIIAQIPKVYRLITTSDVNETSGIIHIYGETGMSILDVISVGDRIQVDLPLIVNRAYRQSITIVARIKETSSTGGNIFNGVVLVYAGELGATKLFPTIKIDTDTGHLLLDITSASDTFPITKDGFAYATISKVLG